LLNRSSSLISCMIITLFMLWTSTLVRWTSLTLGGILVWHILQGVGITRIVLRSYVIFFSSFLYLLFHCNHFYFFYVNSFVNIMWTSQLFSFMCTTATIQTFLSVLICFYNMNFLAIFYIYLNCWNHLTVCVNLIC
jgi:hypothetical protein